MSTNKQCYKLSNDDKKDILLAYNLDNSNDNIQAICKKYNITRQTIWNISKDKKINQSITEYKQSFTEKTNRIIAIMLERIEKEVSNKDNKIALSQLVTSLGILYDKMRLNDNQSTSNQSININIKID